METAPECPDTAALIAVAVRAGHTVSARSLELWRYRGLLPRPERQPGARALWLYPAGTERQLARLLHWRERTRSHDQILVALWVEGFPIELGRVRDALARFVTQWSRMIEVEVADSEIEGEAALVDRLARKLARMRGKAAFPRTARMRLAEREAACGYMVATMLGMEDEVRRREADLSHLERMLGMRSGRDGGLSATLGLKDQGGEVARLPNAEQAGEAIGGATAAEFELVRRIVGVAIVWLPLALPTLLSDQPAKAAHLLDLMRELFADPPPALFPFVLAVAVTLLHAKEPALGELQRHLSALEPGSVERELGELAASEAS